LVVVVVLVEAHVREELAHAVVAEGGVGERVAGLRTRAGLDVVGVDRHRARGDPRRAGDHPLPAILDRLDAAVDEAEVRLVVHAVEALHDRLLDLVDHLRALARDRVDLVDALVVDLDLEVLRPAAVAAQPAARVFAHRSDSMLRAWATPDARRAARTRPRARVASVRAAARAVAAAARRVGEGVRLRLADGRELIDGMSSWWCAIHGYRNPVLDARSRAQLGRMAHVMFGGLTHEPAIELAAARCSSACRRGSSMSSSPTPGSVSVEVAIKMCLQAGAARTWRTRAERCAAATTATPSARWGLRPDRRHAPALRGVLRTTCSRSGRRAASTRGSTSATRRALRELFEAHGGELAAAIVEPVVQGAGGMWFYSPAYLRLLRELCDRHGVLLIFDEIATGFGRAGTLFACRARRRHARRDVRRQGADRRLHDARGDALQQPPSRTVSASTGPLMHGPTYMANPLACSVALASLELLERGDWRAPSPGSSASCARSSPARALAGRARGARARRDRRDRDRAPVDQRSHASRRRNGVWLRPFRNLIYAMPPYVTERGAASRSPSAMVAAAQT
jgi:adenosylmethionine-8-amino-7-oxononanoate aminotransferase